jgi:hypothetical protein
MKRFIRSSRKSHENLTARIKSSDAFSRSQGHQRRMGPVIAAAACPLACNSDQTGAQLRNVAKCQ